MSMTMSRNCDKCGFLEEVGEYISFSIVNKYKISSNSVLIIELDLCSDCIKEIKKWRTSVKKCTT